MATTASASSRPVLPHRARVTGESKQNSIPVRLALAARIAELPGIATVDVPGDASPAAVEIHLQRPASSLRDQLAPILLCRIDQAGIDVHGLDDRDHHQLLSRRWGRLGASYVQLWLPRDNEELEVCWSVVRRAYARLLDIATNSQPDRISGWPKDRPRFSRTSLQ